MEHNGIQLKQYHNIIFSCFSPEATLHEMKMPAHVLIYVRQGEMTVSDKSRRMTAHAGECVFLRRDHKVTIDKHAYHGMPYMAINVSFDRKALRDYFNAHRADMPTNAKRIREAAVKLDDNAYLQSLFESLKPFADSDTEPSEELVQLKMQEALVCLLESDPRFYPTFFDFHEPWKIDLLQFMERNCTEELTMEEIALYTGRSLATFKRDFAKLSDLTPQQWIIQHRLQRAYEMLTQGNTSVNEVFWRSGFKNRSHFVVAFKNQYGMAPSQIIQSIQQTL